MQVERTGGLEVQEVSEIEGFGSSSDCGVCSLLKRAKIFKRVRDSRFKVVGETDETRETGGKKTRNKW
jgi:hypothetical protein